MNSKLYLEPVERHDYFSAIKEYSTHFCKIQGHGLPLGPASRYEAAWGGRRGQAYPWPSPVFLAINVW